MSARRKSGDAFFRRLIVHGRRSKTGRGIGHHLRTRLLVGLLVALPLVVTIFFGRFMFELLDRWFRPISRHVFGFPIPGAGLILFLLALYLLGVLATNVLGSRFLRLLERWITRVPAVGPVYQGARQITEAFQLRGAERFRRVVLVEFPGPGLRSIGFVTQEEVRLDPRSDSSRVLVFVPTTPNPTTGFLIAVARQDAIPLDLEVEDGVKLVITGGLLLPERLKRPEPEDLTPDE